MKDENGVELPTWYVHSPDNLPGITKAAQSAYKASGKIQIIEFKYDHDPEFITIPEPYRSFDVESKIPAAYRKADDIS